ncbi:ABC transporter ATP-binding protein [Marinicellulosiphila megalodicopiae]|uniref:ABC transporter ATP-binding protein n=1 Tax=Marinicellulosiphila megalodicopiae TaxID=2724896 RepID=UPI003BAF23F0
MNVSIQNLNVSYQQTKVLHDINFDAKPGEIISIIGPNGCGKSTLLKAMCRLIPFDSGQVSINEKSIKQYKQKELATVLAHLPQSAYTPEGLDVFHLVSYGRHPHQGLFNQFTNQDKKIVEEALNQTGLLEFKHKLVSSLSGGQRQRAWIAMILAQQTQIITLDEPTSALDIGHQHEVMQMIQTLADHGKTVIMVVHDLNCAVRFSHKILALKQGKQIGFGPTNKIMNQKLISDLFDVNCDFVQHNHAPIIVAS